LVEKSHYYHGLLGEIAEKKTTARSRESEHLRLMAPWGGFKYSGVGREYGQHGIEASLEPKAILEA
jgi:hypothetical protein